MTAADLDVTGIGNAIVDVIGSVNDDLLEQEGLVKGSMLLIDAARAESLRARLHAPQQSCGGSAGNTIVGIRSLGGRAGYVGKVATDSLGDAFVDGMRAASVEDRTVRSASGAPTACCIVLVTPDAQRTMNTFLGACVELGPEDVDQELLRRSRVTYLEGYLWDRPRAKEAFLLAARVAHEAGRHTSLSLSDSFCVDRHRESFLELVANHIDILLCNDAEIMSLYQTQSLEEAVRLAGQQVRVAAVTRGAAGCTVVCEGQAVDLPAAPVTRVVDTTGAGDLFAAGFLHAFVQGRPAAECGRIGSLCASEVISHLGARPECSLAELATKSG